LDYVLQTAQHDPVLRTYELGAFFVSVFFTVFLVDVGVVVVSGSDSVTGSVSDGATAMFFKPSSIADLSDSVVLSKPAFFACSRNFGK
jgi:hypothetical protein